MSNIYIQEPPTCGKVLLITTVGDIDIELWSKETPKACRNFIQLIMEGYYNGTTFHRIVKGFIAQGGDPSGTGTGGESIYGHPFKDEFHTRLRFCRRGLVAMANAGKDDNGSQFFFTFAPCPELQNKHTIFGKVTGETIYNMIKLEEADTDHNDAPYYPQKILKAEVLNNPFDDIVPRCLPPKKERKKKTEKSAAGIKNFKLLSFGEEAAEDEEESKEVSLSLAGKSKSTHDVLNDPKLSSVPVTEDNPLIQVVKESESTEQGGKVIEVRAKLSDGKLKRKLDAKESGNLEDDDKEYDFSREKTEKKKQKLQEIAAEIEALKKDYRKSKKQEKKSDEKQAEVKRNIKETETKSEGNEMIQEYKSNLEKYKHLKKNMSSKGGDRENMTMQLLAKFKQKLQVIKEKAYEMDEQSKELCDETKNNVEKEDGDSWLAHKFNFDGDAPVLAKDANMKTDDWFDITDPRNPINKRRREQSKANSKKPH
ncbi:hypothetical protein RUM43_014630 [Polyplax serrata]|uniref:Spliceosome-associated protein CWC27 homolog n=1 Tax=Polyplax serrata TaxID=468196 RepID=A0AAN8P4B4_POLSC